jgi:ribosomal protein L21
MNKEMLKTLVKQHFNLVEAKPETQTFAEASLVDGTKVSNDEGADFAIGQTLFVTTEDGSKVIAPVGLHTTESGIAIDVDAEGKIVGIHHPDAEPDGSHRERGHRQRACRLPDQLSDGFLAHGRT